MYSVEYQDDVVTHEKDVSRVARGKGRQCRTKDRHELVHLDDVRTVTPEVEIDHRFHVFSSGVPGHVFEVANLLAQHLEATRRQADLDLVVDVEHHFFLDLGRVRRYASHGVSLL